MDDSVNWLSRFEKDQVVPTRDQAYWTINRAIERMVEQNHDHKFSYDREVLIEMLDAALAKQSGEAAQ